MSPWEVPTAESGPAEWVHGSEQSPLAEVHSHYHRLAGVSNPAMTRRDHPDPLVNESEATRAVGGACRAGRRLVSLSHGSHGGGLNSERCMVSKTIRYTDTGSYSTVSEKRRLMAALRKARRNHPRARSIAVEFVDPSRPMVSAMRVDVTTQVRVQVVR